MPAPKEADIREQAGPSMQQIEQQLAAPRHRRRGLCQETASIAGLPRGSLGFLTKLWAELHWRPGFTAGAGFSGGFALTHEKPDKFMSRPQGPE